MQVTGVSPTTSNQVCISVGRGRQECNEAERRITKLRENSSSVAKEDELECNQRVCTEDVLQI